MYHKIKRTRGALRRLSCFLLPPFLILTAVVVLLTQFTELASRNEILSLTSFLVILTFSSLAFNWCRVSTDSCPEEDLVAVYDCGVDLFLSSMMALIAAFFSWLQLGGAGLPAFLNPLLFALHWFFLLVALVLFAIAVFHLLDVVSREDPGNQGGA
jgi:hypothetical protein